MIESEALRHPAIKHGFFSRKGGVSTDLYDSLNCGPGSADDEKLVVQNRQRAMALLDLPGKPLLSVHQIHSANVVVIDDTTAFSQKPKADAMVTTIPEIGLGILTADCVPILFCDPVNAVIGAAHSGWRGAVSGIPGATIASMIKLGAEPQYIRAAIGPAIQQNSYEVGPEFPKAFIDLDRNNIDFFIPSIRDGHHMFDLTGYVYRQLEQQSLAEIERMENDTCKEEDMFYSYRRMTKRGEGDYGRQISIIALTG